MLGEESPDDVKPMVVEDAPADEKNVRDVHKSDVDPGAFPELLKQYYQRLFPYQRYYKWLSYGNVDKKCFPNREFSFTLKDDVYVRYQSFQNLQELTEAIQKFNPYKIDIGAVFTAPPKQHKKIKPSEFYPTQKEIVFDIDLTDYDEVRTCCSGAAICEKCWQFMTCAIKVIDTALRTDFDFQNLLWVYSGRRGVHCWVGDKRARMLSQEGRTAVAEYLNVVKGGDQMARKVSLTKTPYPALERAIDICTPYFNEMVLGRDGQDVLSTLEGQKQMLAILGDDDVAEEVLSAWEQNPDTSSRSKWKYLCGILKSESTKAKNPKRELATRKNEIILQYTYPRLDINVSKQLNHLLKSPFVVHPKTGRVCVCLDVENIEEFSPFDVPTIPDLCREIDEYSGPAEESGRKMKDIKKTSLLKYISLFDKFLMSLNDEVRAERLAAQEEASAAGEW